jgi:YVTN family beta-propeller protein
MQRGGSVIDTATNTVTTTIPAGPYPFAIAITPDGSKVYVTNRGFNFTQVIDTVTNAVNASVRTGFRAGNAIAVTPDGTKVYVAGGNLGVAVIDTATDTLVGSPIPVLAIGLAVSPDSSKLYVASQLDDTAVSVIDTATNAVTATIPVASNPGALAVTPDGGKVYIVNSDDNTVSVIDTAINTVVAVVPVGNSPASFGVFIQSRYAGTPGDANCHGKSVSALAQTFGGLNPAAIALGFPNAQALQTAIDAFCAA